MFFYSLLFLFIHLCLHEMMDVNHQIWKCSHYIVQLILMQYGTNIFDHSFSHRRGSTQPSWFWEGWVSLGIVSPRLMRGLASVHCLFFLRGVFTLYVEDGEYFAYWVSYSISFLQTFSCWNRCFYCFSDHKGHRKGGQQTCMNEVNTGSQEMGRKHLWLEVVLS